MIQEPECLKQISLRCCILKTNFQSMVPTRKKVQDLALHFAKNLLSEIRGDWRLKVFSIRALLFLSISQKQTEKSKFKAPVQYLQSNRSLLQFPQKIV